VRSFTRRRRRRDEQLQRLGRVDPVALGSGREDLLEAGELQVVDIEQLPAPDLDQAVKRSDMAVVAFHGYRNWIGIASGVLLDPAEEILEPRRRMRDLEGLKQTAVRETDGNRVALRADKIVGSSFGLVYLQSHNR
jgi:hypothetical protein